MKPIRIGSASRIEIGYDGENGARTVVFDAKKWMDEMPGCTAAITAQRADGQEYIAPDVTQDEAERTITWTLTSAETMEGEGRAQLLWMDGERIAKQAIFTTVCHESLKSDATQIGVQEPVWAQQSLAAAQEARQSAEAAKVSEIGAQNVLEETKGVLDAATGNIVDVGKRADAAQTAAEKNKRDIGQLKADLTYIGNVGFNLFDKTKIEENTMYQSSTGVLIDREGYYTVFFSVDSEKNLRIRSSKITYRISLFDASKNFISQIEGGAYASSISDARYVGVTFENTVDADTLMIAYTQETSGAYLDKWATLFPDVPEYVPYGFYINAKSVLTENGDSIEQIINEICGFAPNDIIGRLSLVDGVIISEDEYLGVKTATFTGSTVTKTHAQLEIPCIPCKTYLLEFLGMSNYVDYSADFTRGAMLIVEFFDSNGSIIGSKYNSYVLGYNRLGYHRYGFVSPFGAKTVKIRFSTRANTNMTVSNVSFKCVESYPQKQRNGILYDGHQGMPFAAPKNTLASFELGKIAGFSTMITNINVTSDGVLVALHDDTIDATSNGSGNVRDYTYSELLNYDFGSWFNAAYTGTKIPKFEEVVKYLSTCGIKLGVSLHENTLTNDELDEMCEIIKKYGQRECLVKSFSFSMLEHVYSVLGNSAEYMWDYNATSTSDIDRLIALGAERVALEFDSDSVNDTVIEYARSNGVDCSVYFGNDIAQVKALVNKGITRFTVDTFSDIVFPMD